MNNDSKESWGLTVLRVVVGIVFLKHGWMKVFTFGLHGTAGFFAAAHIPLPLISAFLVTWVELLGGLALILGALTQPAAALIAIDMVGAIVFVHLKNGFFLPTGYEFALTMLAANVCLMLAGPGAQAIDNFIFYSANTRD
jgi:putative oxidoreductase